MTEETSNSITSVAICCACVAIVMLVAKCTVTVDAAAEQSRIEEAKIEERLSAERIKAGLEYVSQGSWIKRQPIKPATGEVR